MRHPIPLALTLLLVAGCGAGSPTVTNTPPPPPPVAATLAVQGGDNQQGEPGHPLPSSISVIVRDAAGNGVAGVAVTFAVDSGGGTITATQVTTGANGIATVAWTPGAGPNVLIATVGTLAPVRVRAEGRFAVTRTVINGQAVGAGGGTLRYTQAGDALSGLEITVPAGAYPVSTTWTVTADSTVLVSLPADFAQVGPVLVIANGQGYAASLIGVTVPMRLSAADAVEPFFYDQASGTLEGVPLLARTDTSITFASRHFSGSLMAIPGSAPGPAGIRSSLRVFGTIKMVFIKLPFSKLVGTFTSTFRPGQDDWEFTNLGDYQSPTGICEGMTATALYYHYFFRNAGAPQLFGRFDKFLTNDWDNVRGVHLAGAVQADYASLYSAMKIQQEAIRDIVGRFSETVESMAATWILFNLKMNQRPLLVGVHGPPGSHAVIAYQATSAGGTVQVGIADPNHPGVGRTLTFQNGAMVPLQFQTIATGPADFFINATVFGETSETPLTSFNSRWAEFIAGNPGEDRLPNPRAFEVYDSVTATWSPLPDTLRLMSDTLMLRMRCPGCPLVFTNAVAGPDLVQLAVLDPPGTTQFAAGTFPHVQIPEGTVQLFAQSTALAAGHGNAFLDAKMFTIIRGKLRLFPQFLSGYKDTVYKFTLTHGGVAKANTRYVWDFGDGTAIQTVTGDSIRTHAYATLGNYTVTIEMRDAGNTLLGRTTSLVTIADTPSPNMAWKFTSAAVSFSLSQNPVVQFGSYDSRWRADSEIIGRMATGVTQGGIQLVDQAFVPTGFPLRTAPAGLYLLEGASLTLANLQDPVSLNTFSVATFPNASLTIPATPQVSAWNLVDKAAPLNSLCNIYEDSYVLNGTVTSGQLTGLRVPLCVQSFILPNVNGQRLMSMEADVTFGATTATGTITVTYYFYGNGLVPQFFQRAARLTFTAVRLVQ